MAENDQTKVCPFCAETVKAAAKLCPFCRSKQGRYVFFRQELMLGAGVALPLIAAVAFICWVAPDEEGPGGRSFAGHQSDLVVLNPLLERNGKKPDFWMTGVVTNRSGDPWRVQELEVRFLDGRGNLLDVRHPDVKNPFVVQSHQEQGFRVGLGGLSFTNNNVAHQVRVQMATDGDQPLKSD